MHTLPLPLRHPQVDVYSFGIVLWELWTLREPFEVGSCALRRPACGVCAPCFQCANFGRD